jgi:hypothetical protein
LIQNVLMVTASFLALFDGFCGERQQTVLSSEDSEAISDNGSKTNVRPVYPRYVADPSCRA